MRWTTLGSGTLEFHPQRGCSSHLVRWGDGALLIDSGPGCLDRLARGAVDPRDLVGVLHSHRHLDHVSDLWPLLFWRVAVGHSGRPAPPLLLAGAPGHRAWVEGVAAALYPKLMESALHWHEQPDDGVTTPLPGTPLSVAAFPAAHSASPRILRLAGGGSSFAYSGDTGPCDGLAAAAHGVDWLVVECTSPDSRPRRGHLTPADVAAVCRDARPRGVCLVHLSPDWASPDDAARAVRDHGVGDTEVIGAYDGLELAGR